LHVINLNRKKDEFKLLNAELVQAFHAGDEAALKRLSVQVAEIQDQISASITAAGGDLDEEFEEDEQHEDATEPESAISKHMEELVNSVPALALAAERTEAMQYLQEIRGVHDKGNEKMMMLEKLRGEHAAEKGRYQYHF
jgi:hypothetical protein